VGRLLVHHRETPSGDDLRLLQRLLCRVDHLGLLGRFAKWGANAWVMMILGVLIGVAVFSGAFSGIGALIN
jgi:hypothetical protein